MNAAVTSAASLSSNVPLPERRTQRPQSETAADASLSAQEDAVSVNFQQPRSRETVRSIDDAIALAGILRSGILERKSAALGAHKGSERDGLAELLSQ